MVLHEIEINGVFNVYVIIPNKMFEVHWFYSTIHGLCIVYCGECENMLAVHISWGLCIFTERRRVGRNVYLDIEAKQHLRI
jgi:hypothetical protein